MQGIGTRSRRPRTWTWIGSAALVAALAVGLLSGCSSKKDAPAPDARATITGRLVDVSGLPIPEATVFSQGSAVGETSELGEFSVRVAAGAQKLTFSKNGEVLAASCLAVAELTVYALGDVSVYSAAACAALAGGAGDTDADGVQEADELNGWEVLVADGEGVVHGRLVTSDPALPDTDLDGLSDAEERAAGTDPRRKDTDGDLLSDFAELRVFKSDPRSVDTDGDSRGPSGTARSDPNLWDGNELLVSHTSPVLADTDGDGLTDWEEIHSGGTRPLVADLPAIALEVYGDPLISLDVAAVTGCDSAQTYLAQETTEQKDTDLTTTKMGIENTVKLHTEVEAGTSNWPPSASAKLTTDTEFKQAWMHETSSSFTQTSVSDSQRRAGCWESKQVNWANGNIGTTMKLRNLSDLTFKVKDLGIIAYQLRGGGRFSLIGTLDPIAWPEGGFVLGPAGELLFEVKKQDLGADIMKALTKTPSALFFEVGSYSLFQLDDAGVNETVNYAKLGESVVQRTGLLTIDAGAGPAERHLVSTNVYRNPDGTARGVTMKDALAILGIPYESAPQRDGTGAIIGPRMLTRIRGVAAHDLDPARPELGRGFWMIGGSGGAFDPAVAGTTTDFDDVILKNGERISLVYMQDTDLDGLFDREEALLGTDRSRRDTDGDGVSDYDETKVGWGVEVGGRSYMVYPDPRFPDYDGDYLVDGVERGLGTDPFDDNTDGDNTPDTNDPDPLNPPCLGGAKVGMVAWWNAANLGIDACTVDGGVANDGALAGGMVTVAGPYGNTFTMNPNPDQATQYVDVPHHTNLSPRGAVSLSLRVRRNVSTTYPARATLVAKGPWAGEQYALYLLSDGKVEFVLSRSYRYKCWGWLFGWVDSLCADEDRNERLVLSTSAPAVAPGEWTLLTATFGGDMMRIYRNGVQVASAATAGSGSGWQTWTNYLLTNTSPVRLGVSASGLPFSGMLDEVQVFGAGLTPSDVNLHTALGMCLPP